MKYGKIDINKIKGRWQVIEYIDRNPNRPISSGGDDTVESIRMVAEKVNEIVEKINKLEKFTGNNLI